MGVSRRACLIAAAAMVSAAVACSSGNSARHAPSSTAPPAVTATDATIAPVPTQPKPVPTTPPPGPQNPRSQSPNDRRAAERAFLPGVTAVEPWKQVGTAGSRENFAPSVIRLPDGRYRMYANGGPGNGIVSFISANGLQFVPEAGKRLENGGPGTLDCIASHPWVAAIAGGYRMYYQGDANCVSGDQSGQQHAFRIFSAFSRDGLTFQREGVRVDIGGTTGLTAAAHGRVIARTGGDFLMVFSANLAGKDGPADIVSATSNDGLTWSVNRTPVLERAHDPTLIAIDGAIRIYTTFLGDNFLRLDATASGFQPVTWLEFRDLTGARIEELGDADVAVLGDGRLALYGSGKGSNGIGIFVLSTETTPP